MSSLSSMMVFMFSRSSSSSFSSAAAARRPASAWSTSSAQAPSSSRLTARRVSPFPADLPSGSCPPPRPSSAPLPPGSTEPCSMMAPSVQPQSVSNSICPPQPPRHICMRMHICRKAYACTSLHCLMGLIREFSRTYIDSSSQAFEPPITSAPSHS